jgi:AAA domain
VISEDGWLQAVYGDEMHSIADYLRLAAKLRSVMGPHIAALLNAGLTVIFDFPANTVAQRCWMRDILAKHRPRMCSMCWMCPRRSASHGSAHATPKARILLRRLKSSSAEYRPISRRHLRRKASIS